MVPERGFVPLVPSRAARLATVGPFAYLASMIADRQGKGRDCRDGAFIPWDAPRRWPRMIRRVGAWSEQARPWRPALDDLFDVTHYPGLD
jgi:hypothetical protein